jgi:RloB-like protein
MPRKPPVYRRNPSRRNAIKPILIVCEGQKTEPFYFKSLRNYLKLSLVEVEVVSASGTNAQNVVNHAIKLKKKRSARARKENVEDYEEVWCVFDTENPIQNPQLQPTLIKAVNNSLKLAVSRPVFEYWFLLHFQYTNRPFTDYNGVESELLQHFSNYTKSMDVFNLIKQQTNIAIANAEQSLTQHGYLSVNSGSWNRTVPPDSSTTVHELFLKLKNLKPFSVIP